MIVRIPEVVPDGKGSSKGVKGGINRAEGNMRGGRNECKTFIENVGIKFGII